MNINNQLGSRPSIRLYPGVSAGGSFASFCGGGPEQKSAPTNRGQAASQILKQVQQQKASASNLSAGRSAQAYGEPACTKPREPVDNSLRRRTVIDASQQEVENTYQPAYGIGNRILPDRHAEQPLGGEVEAGYGIGNRTVEQPSHQPLGGEIQAGYGIGNRTVEQPTHRGRRATPAQSEGTSLNFGSDKQEPVRTSRRRGAPVQTDRPDWMGGSTAKVQDKRRTIDCSPPTSETETNFPPQQAAPQQAAPQQVQPMPALSREEFDRLMEVEQQARAAEARKYQSSNQEYNQIPEPEPLQVPGLTQKAYSVRDVPGLAQDRATQQQAPSGPAGRRRKGGDRFVLEDGTQRASEKSEQEKVMMRQKAEQRMKARPF